MEIEELTEDKLDSIFNKIKSDVKDCETQEFDI